MKLIRRRKYTWTLLFLCALTATYVFFKRNNLESADKQHDENDHVAVINDIPVAVSHKKLDIHKPDIRRQHKVKRNAENSQDRQLQETKRMVKQTDADVQMRYVISEPPVRQVAFLKVDQAESTVIQNILFRFGIQNGLTFVLPKQGHSINSNKDILPIDTKKHYDIFACQTIYRPDRFSMMSPGYKTLAIVREPLQRSISVSHHYRTAYEVLNQTSTPSDNFIRDLINSYKDHDSNRFSRTRNSMAFDFGFANHTKSNDTKTIDEYILYLQREFDIVLIADRLDESLVLMRREFNWMYKDIVYLEHQSFKHTDVKLTMKESEMFNASAYFDYKIYNMFNGIFDAKVKELGKEFLEEVIHFRQILRNVNTFCLKRGANSDLEIAESVWHEEFKIIFDECELMKLNEIQFVKYLKERHKKINGEKERERERERERKRNLTKKV